VTVEPSDQVLLELLREAEIEPIDIEIFRIAMTHSSYLNEKGLPPWHGNERLEFLGDAVIGLVVTQTLYERFPQSREGALSKIKSVAVSRAVLAERAAEADLGKPLLLGVGETKAGGKDRQSILAAVFESFVGAIYLDQGLQRASEFVLKQLDSVLEDLASGDKAQDHKSRLQELTQREVGVIPRYRVARSEGPDHEKWFQIEVSVKGLTLARGAGPSKKSAEQEAAMKALQALETNGFGELLAANGS
jgi:ribonuclease-3